MLVVWQEERPKLNVELDSSSDDDDVVEVPVPAALFGSAAAAGDEEADRPVGALGLFKRHKPAPSE